MNIYNLNKSIFSKLYSILFQLKVIVLDSSPIIIAVIYKFMNMIYALFIDILLQNLYVIIKIFL